MVHHVFFTRVVGFKFHALSIDKGHDVELKREPVSVPVLPLFYVRGSGGEGERYSLWLDCLSTVKSHL